MKSPGTLAGFFYFSGLLSKIKVFFSFLVYLFEKGIPFSSHSVTQSSFYWWFWKWKLHWMPMWKLAENCGKYTWLFSVLMNIGTSIFTFTGILSAPPSPAPLPVFLPTFHTVVRPTRIDPSETLGLAGSTHVSGQTKDAFGPTITNSRVRNLEEESVTPAASTWTFSSFMWENCWDLNEPKSINLLILTLLIKLTVLVCVQYICLCQYTEIS